MSDTVSVSVDDTSWTDVSTPGGSSGFITNNCQSTVIYREAASQPAANVSTGHRLFAKDDVNYTVTGGQSIWVKCLRGSGNIAVTGG